MDRFMSVCLKIKFELKALLKVQTCDTLFVHRTALVMKRLVIGFI